MKSLLTLTAQDWQAKGGRAMDKCGEDCTAICDFCGHLFRHERDIGEELLYQTRKSSALGRKM